MGKLISYQIRKYFSEKSPRVAEKNPEKAGTTGKLLPGRRDLPFPLFLLPEFFKNTSPAYCAISLIMLPNNEGYYVRPKDRLPLVHYSPA